ncbi:hypothetical protein CVT24_010841, partial [Panaeolus cyanescens]
GLTSVFQPCDVGVQRPFKHSAKRSYHEDIVQSFMQQLSASEKRSNEDCTENTHDKPVQHLDLVFSKKVGPLRDASVRWLWNAYNAINNTALVKKAFENSSVRSWNLSYESLTSFAAREHLRNLRHTDNDFWMELSRESDTLPTIAATPNNNQPTKPLAEDKENEDEEMIHEGSCETDSHLPLSIVIQQAQTSPTPSPASESSLPIAAPELSDAEKGFVVLEEGTQHFSNLPLNSNLSSKQPLKRRASILIVLFENPQTQLIDVLLTTRHRKLRLNGGETAFPGGKADEGDGDCWIYTAYREAHEEASLPFPIPPNLHPSYWPVCGCPLSTSNSRLSTASEHNTTSNLYTLGVLEPQTFGPLVVLPVVSLLLQDNRDKFLRRLKGGDGEVEALFSVPLERFLGELPQEKWYELEEHIIWTTKDIESGAVDGAVDGSKDPEPDENRLASPTNGPPRPIFVYGDEGWLDEDGRGYHVSNQIHSHI